MGSSNKRDRASMREGPLAELFRKTEQHPAGEAAPAVEAAAVEPPAAPEPGLTEPATSAGRAEREYPHPGFDADAPEPEPERHVPTPQERLRHAFSSDIPENIMERSAPARPVTPPSRPAAERASSFEDNPWSDSAQETGKPVIRVVGVGGAGVNAVNRMVEAQVEGVEFVAVNTDMQSLQQSDADITIHIGEALTRGLGAGANPELGRAAAMEDYDRIKHLLNKNLIIIIRHPVQLFQSPPDLVNHLQKSLRTVKARNCFCHLPQQQIQIL